MKSTAQSPIQELISLRRDVGRLASAAGEQIMRCFRSSQLKVQTKPDGSPVTEADLMAEAVLSPGLKALGCFVVSEENPASVQEFFVNRPKRYWLVDPLDGTRDFIQGQDNFAISIALMDRGEPKFALVYAPALQVFYWAGLGTGAFQDSGDADSAERLSVNIGRKHGQWIGASSPRSLSPRLAGFYDSLGVKEVQRMGSVLKMCAVASGQVDIYPRFGLTSEWDTAAGQLILEEAGGRVLDPASGLVLKYEKPNLLNANGFLATRLSWIEIEPSLVLARKSMR